VRLWVKENPQPTAVRLERSRPDGLRDPVRLQSCSVCGQGVAIGAVRIAGQRSPQASLGLRSKAESTFLFRDEAFPGDEAKH
jgi:hypothetical protein